MVPRLVERFRKKIAPELTQELACSNVMRVPRLKAISVGMCLREATSDMKALERAMDDISAICGQRPQITRAKKSIAAFKIREGMPLGCVVTLRGSHMYEFFDRLVNVALPRVRDFRGLSEKSFDGRGNYSLGIKEQIIFPEINYDKVDKVRGMNITIQTTGKTDKEAFLLLEKMGMPFRKRQVQ